ncbi:MAG: ABC transporter permease [Clostridiaceae bacterium]
MKLDKIFSALIVHLKISFIGVILGSVLGIILASLIINSKKASKVIMTVVDAIQTVPTMAMLIFIMLIFGLNDNTVICAIFLYSLFPIVRNTYVGLSSVDAGILRAGKGIGMTRMQLYFKVKLPLAMPYIIAGIRLAIVTALATTTTGVFVGAGGLGGYIWRGIQTRNNLMILSGAVPVSLLAIIFEYLLGFIEKRLKKGR